MKSQERQSNGMSRRAVLAGAIALTGCGKSRALSSTAALEILPLKEASLRPIGCCITTDQLGDRDFIHLLLRNVSQITAGWEMKMSAIVGPDGGFRFGAADAIASFATSNGLALHGHTLVWYKYVPDSFAKLANDLKSFENLYRSYITTTVGRFRGRVRGWDVVNEPISQDGSGYRNSFWSQMLGGEDHIVRACEYAAAADPLAARFVNDYGLEHPAKRLTFMRLIERLQKKGARIDGIGTQSHINIELAPGAAAAAIKDLANLGLLVHVSELDISLGHRRLEWRSMAERLDIQARRAGEIAEAYAALPTHQQYGLTFWGLRDRDSWLRQPPSNGQGLDWPLPFDDQGVPKPMARAIEEGLQARPQVGGGAKR